MNGIQGESRLRTHPPASDATTQGRRAQSHPSGRQDVRIEPIENDRQTEDRHPGETQAVVAQDDQSEHELQTDSPEDRS